MDNTSSGVSDAALIESPYPAEYGADSAPAQIHRADSKPLTVAYFGAFCMILGYYARFEDWIPGARILPLALIGGFLAYAGFIAHLLTGGTLQRKKETALIFLFLLWLTACVPLSIWPGGSLGIVKECGKVLIMAVIMMTAVNSMRRLRWLLLIQVVSITLIGWFSRDAINTQYDRLEGVISGVFSNPNDLALVIGVTMPIVFYFFFSTKRIWLKAICLFSMGILVYVVILTYSRTGFIALMISVTAAVWHVGVRGKRTAIIAAFAILLFGSALAIAPTEYGLRVASIFIGSLDNRGAKEGGSKQSAGSRDARIEIMKKSLQTSIENPVFGVGPGNFKVVGDWHVSHNLYLQLTSECGFMSLLIYLAILGKAFSNLKQSIKASPPNSDTWLLAGCLQASLIGFTFGVFFANFAFQYFTYFLLSYPAALHGIVLWNSQNPAVAAPAPEQAA